MKLLVLLAVLALAYCLWRKRDAPVPPAQRGAPDTPRIPQPMLRCAVCGLHLPASDAITTTTGTYCCEEHQRQAAARK